jgi:hypothetical protein
VGATHPSEYSNLNCFQINGQLHQVFHLYDKSTGMTFKAIKGPGGQGFQAIGQSAGQIFNVANGNSGQQQMVSNGNQQQQFTQNSMNGAQVQMSQPIVIQQPQGRFQNKFSRR